MSEQIKHDGQPVDVPDLPKPKHLRRQMRRDGGYEMVPAYTAEEMQEYARAAIAAAESALAHCQACGGTGIDVSFGDADDGDTVEFPCHACHPQAMAADSVDADVESKWISVWQDIIAPNGVVDVEQMKKELADYSTLLEFVPTVYMHITGGKISKPHTLPDVVCAVADDHSTECTNAIIAAEMEAQPPAGAMPDATKLTRYSSTTLRGGISGMESNPHGAYVKLDDVNAMLAAAPKPAAETCENGQPDCGPVAHHDIEGVPLCARCWQLEPDACTPTSPS